MAVSWTAVPAALTDSVDTSTRCPLPANVDLTKCAAKPPQEGWDTGRSRLEGERVRCVHHSSHRDGPRVEAVQEGSSTTSVGRKGRGVPPTGCSCDKIFFFPL